MNTDQNQDLKARIRILSAPLQPHPTSWEPIIDTLPGIRALLFDIYGTLVISASGDIGLAGEQDEADAFGSALNAAGIEAPSGTGRGALKDAIRRRHIERKAAGCAFPEVDILTIWREVLGGEANPVSASPLPEGKENKMRTWRDDLLERLAVEYESRVNPVWPMPNLKPVLAELARRGLVLGIVSNAQFYTPLMLEAFLEEPLPDIGFDPACCSFSYRLLEAKPSTRIYDQALSGLAAVHGIAAGNVLYVGNDMRNDIWPAARMGCRTALFAGDQRSLRLRRDDPDCAAVTPDRVITDLRQITDSILRR